MHYTYRRCWSHAFMLSPWPVEFRELDFLVNAPLTTKLAEGMQDVVYLNTTTAICEHVDISLAANASEVRVYFREPRTTWSRSAHPGKIDLLVYDSG